MPKRTDISKILILGSNRARALKGHAFQACRNGLNNDAALAEGKDFVKMMEECKR
ncbi:MAG: hypothetical protein ACLPLR_14550 [Terriglobales bacterium]